MKEYASNVVEKMHRIEVGVRKGLRDAAGERAARAARENLGVPVQAARSIEVYTIDDAGAISQQQAEFLAREVFADSVANEFSVNAPLANCEEFDWAVEVGFLPGVTDNAGATASKAIEDALAAKTGAAAYYSVQYLLKGSISPPQAQAVAESLYNGQVERFELKSSREWGNGFAPFAPKVVIPSAVQDGEINLSVDDESLKKISREGLLSLSLEEMRAVKSYFEEASVLSQRKAAGLGSNPTRAELEAIAQTWSEHCKHKIFNALIDYSEQDEDGNEIPNARRTINSLFDTFVKSTTGLVSAGKPRGFLASVFSDNAGIVEFDNDNYIAVKVETHNAPSALDPYGGALTGIVGVNRDVLGAGLGARLVFNTDVFCFGPPTMQVPEGVIAPKRIFEGVRRGVEHGGNKSGVPTVNGSIVFDPRFAYRPLVYCGTCGIMPKIAGGRPSHEKSASAGDLIVVCGGRVGKDGIHGATFSSAEISRNSPAGAVQLGDPITQKKTADFLLEARDAGLYTAITDNGAGGLSSSVGEMARLSGGFELHLEKSPLKYPGLQPWEILVSESQERMTLAVPKEKLDELLKLAQRHEVECSVLGEFTESGKFHCLYKGKTVALLEMGFLHGGVPQMKLKAKWRAPTYSEIEFTEPSNQEYAEILKSILGRLNVCSKEYVVRQYDHEVQGGSVVKPLTGHSNSGPSDAGVFRPILGSSEAIVVSNGICPKYSDLDAAAMAECAFDEALRNYLATGGQLEYAVGLDNFCWCDPLPSQSNPQAEEKLAQLVRACSAMNQLCVAYKLPLVSGKDSMKNDYITQEGKRISIPPTLLATVVGKITDAGKAVTIDAKKPCDLVYALGETNSELGASEYATLKGSAKGFAPRVDATKAYALYTSLQKAMERGLVASCHDCSDGGLAAALAETAFSGGLGMQVELAKVPKTEGVARNDVVLFSESQSRFVATIHPENAEEFEKIIAESAGTSFAKIGLVTDTKDFSVTGLNGEKIIGCPVRELEAAWKKTLDW